MITSSVHNNGRVEIVVSRNQSNLALVCVGPDHDLATVHDLDRLIALGQDNNGAASAIVTSAGRGKFVLQAAWGTDVLLLDFEDLTRLDDLAMVQ